MSIVSHSGSKKSSATSDLAGAATPLSLEEKLLRIEAMGRRIDRYVKFMCQVAGENAVSNETRERAVGTFYEKLTRAEADLAQLYEQFRLE